MTVSFDGAVTPNTGALLFAAIDQAIKLTTLRRLLCRGRDPARVEHEVATLVDQWLVAITRPLAQDKARQNRLRLCPRELISENSPQLEIT